MIRRIEGILDIPGEEQRQTSLAPPLPRKDTVDFRQSTLSASKSTKALLCIINNPAVFHHSVQLLAKDFLKDKDIGTESNNRTVVSNFKSTYDVRNQRRDPRLGPWNWMLLYIVPERGQCHPCSILVECHPHCNSCHAAARSKPLPQF